MSHDYRIDRLMLTRLKILAEATGHRVIGVETPGVTLNFSNPDEIHPSHVPSTEVLQAATGDFTGIAGIQAAAILGTTGVEVGGSRIVGESLGAQLGASLATVAARAVRSLDLVEPVNARALSPRRLWNLQKALNTVERQRKADYLHHNSASGWGDVTAFELSSPENAVTDRRLKSFRQQGRYALAFAIGLSSGLARTLEHVEPSVPVRVWRANASEACRRVDLRALVDECRSKGPIPTLIEMEAPRSWPAGLGHHCLTDLDLMVAFANQLRIEWQ